MLRRPNPSRACRRPAVGIVAFVLLALTGCGTGADIPPASVLATGELTITWTALPGAKGYHVYMSTSPGVSRFTGYRMSTPRASITISDLRPGTTYYFVVTALTDSGETEASGEIAYTAKATSGAVSLQRIFKTAPPTPRADNLADGEATLAWEDSPDADSYNIYYGTSPGVTKETGTRIENARNPFKFKGLQKGQTYYFVVTAVTPDGESPVSEEVSYTPQ
jgi:hypothetical protein